MARDAAVVANWPRSSIRHVAAWPL